jgi:V-type H+-transporting ATPase subunit a
MGTLWRSEHMQLVQLFVQIEAAHDTVDELGQLGVIQFRDVRTNNFGHGSKYTPLFVCGD